MSVPEVDYDHYAEDFARDPHDEWARLRRECPVAHTGNHGGFFVASRHEDIDRIVHEPELFSSFPADTPPDPRHTVPLIPMEVDPPEHRRYRRMFEPMFRPKLVAELEPAIRQDAAALVDRMLEAGEFDFIEVFALPLPSFAFLRLLGLDADRGLVDRLGEAVNEVLHTVGAPSGDIEAQQAVRARGFRTMKDFLRGVLTGELKAGDDGLIRIVLDESFLADNAVSAKEVQSFLHVLLLGGLETVTTALGFSFLHLGRRPELRRLLADRPELVPSALEEMLRYESSVHPTRTVTRACTLGDVALSAGDRVVIPYGSANRDEAVFDRPHEILLDREGNRHMAFGAGNHRCLGSHLARLELRIAFEEIFRRMPEFTVDPDFVPRAYGGQTRAIADLPMRVGSSMNRS